MSYLLHEILQKVENNYSENPEGKRLATLDMLTDIAWEMSTAKKLIAMTEEDIVNWSDKGFEHYVKIRKHELVNKEAELKRLQESFDDALSILKLIDK